MKNFWTKLSLQDLKNIKAFISSDNPKAAEDLLILIKNSVESLSSFPSLGRTGRVKSTRELIIAGTPYIISYRVKKDNIEILSVMHGSRKWPEKF